MAGGLFTITSTGRCVMNTRERFHAIMQFEPFDRLPIIEWAGWWDETLGRWYREGLPLYITDRYEICEYFGLDTYRQDWLPVCSPACPEPSAHGAGILGSETEYERVREFLYPEDSVDPATWTRWAAEQERGDSVLWFTVDGMFWFPRRLLGIERHFYAFYDRPQLIHRINADLTEWILDVIDRVCSVCTPDFMTFAEDLSYNHGAMLSKDLFDEFIRPYYAVIVPHLKKHGILTMVDSDGEISEPAGWFGGVGVEGMLPLERQSGVDVGTLRERHPKMRFIGHYDKMVMGAGEEAMRAEFERLLPTAGQGGFLPACDHQTPPGVSFRDYRTYLDLFREYAVRAGELSCTGCP